MIRDKVVTADEAIALIRDGDVVSCSGFVGIGTPEELITALERRFVDTDGPRDLTLVFAAAPGDGKEQGLNRLAREGLVQRAIGGHWSLVPKLGKLATDNRIQAYNLPLGTISHLYRDAAAHRAGTLTKVGLGTFVDPRQNGGKINARTTEDLVRVMEIDGEEWLFYKAFPINVALIRGTTADAEGNITMEREALMLDAQAAAMAARNANGLVIVQVERIASSGISRCPKRGRSRRAGRLRGRRSARCTQANLRHGLQRGVLRRDSRSREQDPGPGARREKADREALRFRAAARRGDQPGNRHARGGGRRRCRRARTRPSDLDRRTRRDRRHAARRSRFRRRHQYAGAVASEPAVRLLRRWWPRPRVSWDGRNRPRRQRERQPIRFASRGLGRLHQHQPERPPARVRRDLHRRWNEPPASKAVRCES